MKMAVDTAVTVPVNVCPLIDDTDFKTRETSVAYNAAGLDLVWNFVTPAGVQTQTAVTPTNTGGSYDWVNVGDGMYNIEIPASGGASINNDTEGYGWFSGLATGVLPWVGPIIEFVPAHVVNGLVTGSSNLQVDSIKISGDATAADNLENAYDDTAGPVPWQGIVDQGTAQSASSTGVVLRSAAAFADDTLIGCTIGVYGSTQGYWQFRTITDNALSGDTVTVDTWTVTPSGTITYKIFGGAPASVTLPPAVNVAQWKGSTAPDNTGDAYAIAVSIKTKTDYLPSATAGAAGGVFIAGSNAATTVNFTGNLSGSVGSVTGAVGSVAGNVGGNVVGSVASVTAAVAITSNIKKNQALAEFQFMMTDSTNHEPATGKTVTCTRSIDGAAFAAGTLANVTEVSNGMYTVDFGAGDLNGNVIVLLATATGCDDTFERIITQP